VSLPTELSLWEETLSKGPQGWSKARIGIPKRFLPTLWSLAVPSPPSDADIIEILQKISQRVIRTLYRLGYLETGIDAATATGYDTRPC
jgi:hypothetical protein